MGRPASKNLILANFMQRAIRQSVQKIYTNNMARDEIIVNESDTDLMHYQVVDMIYEGRPARVLFSGQREAAQSGIAKDGKAELLFDYNQRFFELASSINPKRMLLIGGGVYTLPMGLLKASSDLQIDIVELDPGLDELASRFFGWKPDSRVTITHADGKVFLDNNSDRYDLIVVDAYSRAYIPKPLLSKRVAQQLKSHLATDGVVAINLISSYYGRGAELLRHQYATYSDIFKHVEIFPASRSLLSYWLPQNFVLVAHSGKMHKLNLRFEALPPPTE